MSPALLSLQNSIDQLKRPRGLKSLFLQPEFQENVSSMSTACGSALKTLETISSSLAQTKYYLPGEFLRHTSKVTIPAIDSKDENVVEDNNKNEANSEDRDLIRGDVSTIFLEDYDDDLNKKEETDFVESELDFSEIMYTDVY